MNFNKNKIILTKYDIKFSKFKPRKDLKKLLVKKNKSLGRSFGSIVTWHRGGGVKRNFRILSNLDKDFISNFAILRSIEYDPNRSAFIGLIQYQNGAFANIIVSSMMKIGEVIGLFTNKITDIRKNGDFLKLKYAPIGLPIYNLEKFPGSGPVYSKAAGVYSKLLTKDLKYGKVKLPSGEERLFDLNCTLTLGIPSNIYRQFNKKYKAGTNRLLNHRPIVRGVAMNPIDHPHGGGAGKTAPGRPSVSPWGKLTKGVPSRNFNLKNKLIIKRL